MAACVRFSRQRLKIDSLPQTVEQPQLWLLHLLLQLLQDSISASSNFVAESKRPLQCQVHLKVVLLSSGKSEYGYSVHWVVKMTFHNNTEWKSSLEPMALVPFPESKV